MRRVVGDHDLDEAIGVRIGKRSQQERVDDRKHRAVRADADRQHRDRGHGEPARAGQQPPGVPEIAGDVFNETVHLRTVTVPSFITHRTPPMTSWMFSSGFPSRATMSAAKPGASLPSRFCCPSKPAAVVVAVASAWAGVMPAFTNHSNSRVFCPNIVNTASDPMPIFTPALNARAVDSRFFAM